MIVKISNESYKNFLNREFLVGWSTLEAEMVSLLILFEVINNLENKIDLFYPLLDSLQMIVVSLEQIFS